MMLPSCLLGQLLDRLCWACEGFSGASKTIEASGWGDGGLRISAMAAPRDLDKQQKMDG